MTCSICAKRSLQPKCYRCRVAIKEKAKYHASRDFGGYIGSIAGALIAQRLFNHLGELR